MVDMTFIRPLNKGQGHSFWNKSISHIRLPIGFNSNFCSRTHRLTTIRTLQTTTTHDKQKQRCTISATVIVRSAKNYEIMLMRLPDSTLRKNFQRMSVQFTQ